MIKSHICKVPSAYTCLECNMTCEEAKLGQTIFIFTVLAATQTSFEVVVVFVVLFNFIFCRTGTILLGKGIMLRTFVLMV